MAIDKTKNKQVLVTFPNDMLQQIDEYWHENKFKNRNEAIRELIKITLNEKKASK